MDTAFDFDPADLLDAFQHNVVGPALIGKYFITLINKGKRKVIMNMTSGLGSIGANLGPKCSSYSITKHAVNMLVSILLASIEGFGG